MTRSAICYVSDLGFLGPTLMSIESARRFVDVSVPIYLVAILPDAKILDSLQSHIAHLAVTVIPFDENRLKSIAEVWADSHVPLATLGRFFLPELIPEDIERILYVDGDTLFVSSPLPLLSEPLPKGKIGMVEDTLSFYRHDKSANGNHAREYMHGLGLSPEARYANAGVFVVERNTWTAIAKDALAFLSARSGACLHHDQSALNAVLGDRSFPLSPIWNYQSRFLQWRAKPIAKPAILHFTGAAKPWMGKVHPWSAHFDQVTSMLHQLPSNELPVRTLTDEEVKAHNRQYEGLVQLARKFLDLRQMRRVKALRQYYRSAFI